MKRLTTLATMVVLCTAASHAAVWYVVPGGAGDNSGTSWATACATLQSAVDKAGSGDEVWVKAGTYTGTNHAGVVSLKPNIALYGGFSGSETARDQRDYSSNVSIIDGGGAGRCVNAVSGGTVDGFTLIRGYANTYTSGHEGAGMYGGVAINCVFSGNNAGNGGGMYQGTSINCIFQGNTASTNSGYAGGACQVTAINCTFYGNNGGHVVYQGMVTNCIIWGNSVLHDTVYKATVSYSSTSSNPMFRNAALGDFRLRADSPCIDKGTSYGAPNTDLSGTARPQGSGIDMGAYEYLTYQVTVPGVVGLTQSAATAAIVAADVVTGTIANIYSPTVPLNIVISQTPIGATQVQSGTAVNIVVSKGPWTVPDLAGKTQADAVAAITAAELALGTVTEQYNTTFPSGKVVSQNPASGTVVQPGTAVDLVISKGPQPVTVPNVVGQSQSAASSTLVTAGLQASTTQQFSESIPAGQVISQSPTAGIQALTGSTVALVVSKGPAILVPNVVGKSEIEARSLISGAGLVINEVKQVHSPTVPTSLVISQSPTASTQVASGARVDITVSKGPDPEDTVPPTPAEISQALYGGFAAADTDGNSALSLREAQTALLGLTLVMFNAMDVDGDGSLSKTELADYLGAGGGSGCSGCNKASFIPGGTKSLLGDLFLAGLSLSVLALMSRRR